MVDLEFISAIADLGIESWNAIAGVEYPFTRYEFLSALETSGDGGIETVLTCLAPSPAPILLSRNARCWEVRPRWNALAPLASSDMST